MRAGILRGNPLVENVTIPKRPVFRSPEVCEIAQVQPYVLKSWEAEFPDLGIAKSPGSPRIYRRADVERVLRLKHLLFVDGLTLAGARKQLTQEGAMPSDEVISDADVASMVDEHTRQSLRDVRRGLHWILGVLNGNGLTPEDRVLTAAPVRASDRKSAAKSRAAASKKKGSKRR